MVPEYSEGGNQESDDRQVDAFLPAEGDAYDPDNEDSDIVYERVRILHHAEDASRRTFRLSALYQISFFF